MRSFEHEQLYCIELSKLHKNDIAKDNIHYPISKVNVANMGPTLVLPAPGGPHVGPMSLAIKVKAVPTLAYVMSVAISGRALKIDQITLATLISLGTTRVIWA